ncbi:DUF2268 domain-containing putative Zn-dependent protease [Salipaludibacillus daqingensis]|uniref:DUF2268 domain-containing putative Zn-dependent protease n=1 Tax=Salipaludibacillus daqingensis TaxID=3041001 RepID=UPI0024748C54|nr:DUF2268 domain-containing putative Zn-dependent protease [Salipaludibacillus daqingensis]
MKVYDSSVWVIKHHYFERSVSKLFEPLFNKDLTKTDAQWLSFLVDQGMIPISKHTKKDWMSWRRRLKLEELTDFLLKLKRVFCGPDIDLFLFPLNSEHQKIMEDLGGKNGCSFSAYMLLFWIENLPLMEQKALLLHEYHHIARLYHQKVNERTISLLESMVMEGLAEWEVGNRLGKDYLAPWTTVYSEDEIKDWWFRLYQHRIHLTGRVSHYPFLYGNIDGIPPMMGYQIGYHLVNKYLKQSLNVDSEMILNIPAHHFLTMDS